MNLFGTVEIGGTKTDVAVGTSFSDLSERERIKTTTPDETLNRVARFFADHEIAAVGVASFGPLHLDRSSSHYGTLMLTPKSGWSGTRIHRELRSRLDVPVLLDTDVNAAARAEGRWGAAQGMESFAYVTVGTGIGAGVVVGGQTVGGGRHPEMGHVSVRRAADDTHAGSCPFHGDCLEGLASGPPLEARFGSPQTWAGNDRLLDVATGYLAQGLLAIFYVAVPERIIVGGGVTRLPGYHDRLRDRLGALIAGYPETPDLDLLVSGPGLGDLSGLAGGLLLAIEGLD